MIIATVNLEQYRLATALLKNWLNCKCMYTFVHRFLHIEFSKN